MAKMKRKINKPKKRTSQIRKSVGSAQTGTKKKKKKR